MIHPDTELRFINPQIGYGVVATRLIPKGTITWVRDDLDRTLSPAQVEAMDSVYQNIITTYAYIDSKGDFVLCWDLARYVNHSCEPSCRMAGYEFEVAVRDIHPGEQLTDEYGYLNIEYDFPCACDSPSCRKHVRAGDLLRYAEAWDQETEAPFRLIPTVTQPLWHLIREKDEVNAILQRQLPIPSCLKHYPLLPAEEYGLLWPDVRSQNHKPARVAHDRALHSAAAPRLPLSVG